MGIWFTRNFYIPCIKRADGTAMGVVKVRFVESMLPKEKRLFFDPYADKEEVKNIYDINLAKFDDICKIKYSGIIICVNHSEFKTFPLSKVSNSNTVIYDVKSMFEKKYERL